MTKGEALELIVQAPDDYGFVIDLGEDDKNNIGQYEVVSIDISDEDQTVYVSAVPDDEEEGEEEEGAEVIDVPFREIKETRKRKTA